MADFKADTDEHGWPSFRLEEVVREHVRVDKDGFVGGKIVCWPNHGIPGLVEVFELEITFGVEFATV